MNEEVLGAKSLPPTSETDQTVVPAVGCPSASVQRNAVPPQSWTSIPRRNLYQARSDTAALALKTLPPMPVTPFMHISMRRNCSCLVDTVSGLTYRAHATSASPAGAME